jgi:atypical dual specificity phosphatase
MSIPTFQQMDSLLKTTQEYINRDQAVVYHCFGGKGRTGTALACYLLRYHPEDFNAESVIPYIRELRPYSIETSSQEHFIADYERYIKGEHPIPRSYDANQDDTKPKFFTIKLRKVVKRPEDFHNE